MSTTVNGIESSAPTTAPKHSSPLHDDVREVTPRMGPYNVNGTAATVSTTGRIEDSVHRRI
ncbi:MAG TPA: hypothetical protein VNO30_22730 [Kofleriaceae bacterium]|nr:hypothetical protein [Kofleriaceae bacterium]